MAAGALLRDDEDRVLLVEPCYKDRWEIPGGAVEADESPYAAVLRELTEELGLAISPGRILVVDWVPPSPDRTESVCVVFDGGILGPAAQTAIRLNEQELLSWAWSTPEQALERLPGLQVRRVQAALQAVRDHVTRYLENGYGMPDENGTLHPEDLSERRRPPFRRKRERPRAEGEDMTISHEADDSAP